MNLKTRLLLSPSATCELGGKRQGKCYQVKSLKGHWRQIFTADNSAQRYGTIQRQTGRFFLYTIPCSFS